MFGIKKNKNEIIDIQSDLKSSVKHLEQVIEKCTHAESVKDSVAQVDNRLKKQEGMLEEALELIDEYQEGLQKLNEEEKKNREETALLMAERQKQAESREAGILELVMMYGEYMENLHRLVKAAGESEPEWQQQWDLMQSSLERTMGECGVEIIREDGRPADPTRIVVVKMEPTPDPGLHNFVAETVIPGWIYQNSIVKKARAVVYKYEEGENDGDDRN